MQYLICETTNALTRTEMTDDGRRPLRCDKPLGNEYVKTASCDGGYIRVSVKVAIKSKADILASEMGTRE